MIEKLKTIKERFFNNIENEHPPDGFEMMLKINEIIDQVNKLEKEFQSMAKFISKD